MAGCACGPRDPGGKRFPDRAAKRLNPRRGAPEAEKAGSSRRTKDVPATAGTESPGIGLREGAGNERVPLAGRLPLQAGAAAAGWRFGANLAGAAVCAAAIRAARRVQASASPHIRRIRPSVRARFAPPRRRQRRRRCLAKHQPARRRSSASARFAPPRRRAAGLSPAAQALPGQASARSAPHRCLRQCPACGARELQRRRCGACRLREAAAAGSRAAGAGLAAARGARGFEEAPPSALA